MTKPTALDQVPTPAAVQVLSDTRCTLGEGALWHPDRQSLFWVDILGQRLFEHDGRAERSWSFDRPVSAAGLVDASTLVVATQCDLMRFDLETGAQHALVPLEADRAETRSNDGRADPQGGFWISTMGFDAQPGAGAIYRYHDGALRRLFDGITIPNAICFSPDGRWAAFADTARRQIYRVALDAAGWPKGAPDVWIDLGTEGHNPDGAVIDSACRLWNAQWGAHRVACYGPEGSLLMAVPFPAAQISCPAFGGAGMNRLFATSAATGLSPAQEEDGRTFFVDLDGATGQTEHRVTLPPAKGHTAP